jgi:hypothetical protein
MEGQVAEDKAVSWEEFTEAQRQRGEALLLVATMFPHGTLGVSHYQAAKWIVGDE